MAEILYNDGRKESVPFAQAPPGDMAFRAPTGFERYRQGRENVTAAPLKAVGMPEEAAKSVAQFLTPQTPAEQGIEVGTAMMPGAGKAAQFAEKVIAKPLGQLAQRGLRSAAPAVGGAVGSLFDQGASLGHTLYEGARGGVLGAAGELLPFAKGLLGRGKAVEKADEKAVGKAVESAVPAFGNVSSKADLDALAVRGRGEKALEGSRTSLLDTLTERLSAANAKTTERAWGAADPARKGAASIDVPSLAKVAGGGSMSVKDAVDWLARLGDRGWLMTNQLATGLDASAARTLRGQARKEIVSALNKSEKGLGDTFDKGMNELAKGRLYIDILGKKGVIEDGKLNMNALRDVMGTKATQKQTYGQRLEHLGSAEDVKAWYDALTRKSGDLVARDTPGSLGFGIHAGLTGPHVWAGVPKLPKYVGEIPPVKIGSGGTPTSRGLLGLSQETAESERR